MLGVPGDCGVLERDLREACGVPMSSCGAEAELRTEAPEPREL